MFLRSKYFLAVECLLRIHKIIHLFFISHFFLSFLRNSWVVSDEFKVVKQGQLGLTHKVASERPN